LASRLRVPAATVLGPMILVGAASALGVARADFPAWVKIALQIVIGVFLGYKIDWESLTRIRTMLRPIALVTIWMVGAAILIGYALARLTSVDLATALLGTSPGGIAEMTAMAISIQADVTLVATLQTFRLIATIGAVPFLARGLVAPTTPAIEEPLPALMPPLNDSTRARPVSNVDRFAWLLYLALGVLGSFIFAMLKIPAAGVIGAMVAVALARIVGCKSCEPPHVLRTLAQVGLGIVIGSAFNDQTLTELRSQFLPILLTTVATVASALMLARVVQRALKTDLQTALLACAPGGLVQMGIIADELGAEVFVVNLFQLTRLVSAVILFPILVRLLLGG
jgi:membrane AbrB-like protein